MKIYNEPGQLVALPLGLGEDQDLGAVTDLLQQPRQLALLLVLLADVHNLGREEDGEDDEDEE